MIRKKYLPAVFAAATALVMISGASASAATSAAKYKVYYFGAYSTQAACESNGAVFNDPPEQYFEGCFYEGFTPPGAIGAGGAGWYLAGAIDIS